jgi:two-component system, NarL family, sensor kinase
MAIGDLGRRLPWRRERDRHDFGRPVLRFALTGIISLIIVAVAGTWLLTRASDEESLHDAKVNTETIARGIIQPELNRALLNGDPVAQAHLRQIVRDRVPASVRRIKVWSQTGQILFSDEPRLVGRRFQLESDLKDVLETGQTQAEKTADVKDAENLFEKKLGPLFEVYLPLRAADGEDVIFETYQDIAEYTTGRRRILNASLPIAIGALVLLWLLQLPLATRLAKQLQARREERERLLRQAVESSESERRRIAADLHDGVVQDLAGLQFALEGAANRARAIEAEDLSNTLRDAAQSTRQNMRQLRSLLVEIHPPNLRSLGLAAALNDLVTPLSARGLEVGLAVAPDLEVGEHAERLLYRAAQEGLRNVVEHSGADAVQVSVTPENGLVRLIVADDGQGFTIEQRKAREDDGHVGLRLLGELAAEADGHLSVVSAPGHGTVLTMEVPRQ